MNNPYRWYILGLGMLTNALVVALQSMCLPVLFKEISVDLGLSLVQIGLVWGISAVPGIFAGLVGGSLGDRFGPKPILILGCLVVGAAGALRGTASDFTTLILTMSLFGLFSPFIGNSVYKTCGYWFSKKQMGLASGVLSMGMALGFLIGSMLSATVLSPVLGGWRNVLFLYGGLAMLLCIPWYFTQTAPSAARAVASLAKSGTFRTNIAYIASIRNIWLLGLTILGIGGCVQGFLGYLPLYLREIGWSPASADGTSAAFHTISMIFVIPIALLSDRLGTRKRVLVVAGIMIATGVGLLSVVEGIFIWLAVCLAGMVRDGFMAVFMTSIIEIKEVGADFAGTAMGMVMIFMGIGSLIAPPIGNSLAAIDPSLPFAFWSFMALMGLAALFVFKELRESRAIVDAVFGKSPEQKLDTGHSHIGQDCRTNC